MIRLGLETKLSAEECDSVFRNIALAARGKSFQSARKIKTTFAYLDPKGRETIVRARIDCTGFSSQWPRFYDFVSTLSRYTHLLSPLTIG